MSLYLTIGAAALASLLTLVFSSITYSLREFSHPRLAEFLGRHDADKWFEPVTDHVSDLVFLTSVGRQLSNILMFVLTFAAFEQTSHSAVVRYGLTILVTIVIAVFCSVAIPHAAAKYSAAEIVGFFAPALHALRIVFSPVTMLMHRTDDVVRHALGVEDAQPQQHAAQEILSAVEEGEKEGVVDEQERAMIESVIEFAATTAGQIMTPRQEMAALPLAATLDDVKRSIDQSGHSRIPIYEGSPDHVVGILHARDLIKHLGVTGEKFSVADLMRPAIFVPETKRLRDLLADFRLQKVQMAVVLDEYGSTAGVVSIEDILEELVGEIGDEHEPVEPPMFKKLDDRTAEADGRIDIEQLNRLLGLTLPEDAGYDTLAGYLLAALARIPEKGTVHEQDAVRFTVLDADPQRVKRVKIELLPHPAPARS